MADEYDQFGGRKPSIGFGKGGPYVRGFRSKPGASKHDPTSNNPMSGNYKWTNWDDVFRNRLGGGQPQGPAQSPAQMPAQDPSLPSSVQLPESNWPTVDMNEEDWMAPINAPAVPGNEMGMSEDQVMGMNPFQMSTNHAQEWSQPSSPKRLGKGTLSQSFGPKGMKNTVQSPYGWGSAFYPNA